MTSQYDKYEPAGCMLCIVQAWCKQINAFKIAFDEINDFAKKSFQTF